MTPRLPSSRRAASSRADRAWASWLSYGLGTDNENFPAFVVMLSRSDPNRGAQALFDCLSPGVWGSCRVSTRA